MSYHFWLGMSVILASGAMNAGFALPMKHFRTWQWENQWVVFSLVGILLVPWALAWGVVPGFIHILSEESARAVFLPLLFGLLWGIAQVTFGIGLRVAGVALTVAVVCGLGSLFGSLIPILAFHPSELFHPRGLALLLSVPFLMVGLVAYGFAGRGREIEQAGSSGKSSSPKASFAVGMALAIFTGVFGSCANLGFAFSGDIIRTGRMHGAGPLTSTYPVWCLVLGAGFFPNILYCLFLLTKNRTANLFRRSGSTREALLALSMALVWIASVLSYGIGATLVGDYGTSLGYMLFTAASVLFANAFGLLSGEWKGASSRTRRRLFTAVGFILIAVIILNCGGFFS